MTVIVFTPHDTKNTCPVRTQRQGIIFQMRPTPPLYYMSSTKLSNAYDLNKRGSEVVSTNGIVPK
jgi:hypothetical protein